MNFLVVGIGNIGAEYENTRHNMGFMVLDAWALASGTVFSSDRYGSVVEIPFRGHKFLLLKPSTFVNLSGKAVRYWMQEKNIPIERVLVVCDDLNLPFGSIRMRASGSDGGHNGLKNIQEVLSSQNYARIRLGIGNEFSRGSQVDYVLGKLSDEQMKQMQDISVKVIEGIKLFALQGVQRAMSAVNSKPKPVEVQTGESSHTD